MTLPGASRATHNKYINHNEEESRKTPHAPAERVVSAATKDPPDHIPDPGKSFLEQVSLNRRWVFIERLRRGLFFLGRQQFWE